MAQITSPIEGFAGKTSFGPLAVEFKDGVAEVDVLLGPAMVAYLERRGYIVDVTEKTIGEIEAGATPSDSWTVQKLLAYAKEHGITAPASGKKADLLEAILTVNAVPAPPADAPPVE